MRFAIRLFPLVCLLWLLSVAPLSAQQIRFDPDFSSVPSAASPIIFNGSSKLGQWQSNIVLRLTDGGSNGETSAAYFKVPQQVNLGFTTYFEFQIHNPTSCCQPGDGFAFILQNSDATASGMGASGSGLSALGAGGGGLGYAGINNSLAVEFDLYNDAWDPNSNHIAIQTCGDGEPNVVFNTPVHLPGVYTIGNDHDVTSCLLSPAAINTTIPPLGGTCNGSSCTDGAVHQVVIEYTPPTEEQPGQLQVWLDPEFLPGTHTPIDGAPTVITVPYNIIYNGQTNPLGLGLTNNSLWVGFTGAQPSSGGGKSRRADQQPSGGTTMDIISWEFTPHAPSQITQQIPNGGIENDFAFGAHVFAVTYPNGGFTNCNPNCIDMTVLATPVNQQTFYTTRLQGTQFADENCITYLGTGNGNCVDYSVTCQENGNQVTCPSESDPTIDICSQFYTPDPASNFNTDFLEADPIGSNNWCSIWFSYTELPVDDIVVGHGKGFSDIVATLSPTGPGQSCNSVEKITKKMEQKQKAQRHQPQGSGICPAID
jgi:hypothetical protein